MNEISNMTATPVRPFVISRVLDAPRDIVWKAHTEADRLQRWFMPKGFTMPTCALDFRPGGFFHYCIRSAQGQEHWGNWAIREIVPLERLGVVVSFSDAERNVTRNPFAGEWPLEMLGTTTFAEKDGKTTLTVAWTPLNPTDAERAAFEAGQESMRAGWSGTLDHLVDYLAKR